MKKAAILRRSGMTAALLLCGAVPLFSKAARDGASGGVELCLKVLVPSLFPFMALSGLAVATGLCSRAGRMLSGVGRRLFGVSGALAPVILLGMIGGYPVGAKGISELVRTGSINKDEAARTALFTVGAGPGFLINYVGLSVYGSSTLGWIMLASQVLTVILTGVAVKFLYRNKNDYISDKEYCSPPRAFGDALIASTRDACTSMAGICALVVLFSSFSGIVNSFISDADARFIIGALLEVTTAVSAANQRFGAVGTAFAVGFGGLCVHAQILSVLGEAHVNKGLFFLFRIISGALTALFTKLGMLLFLVDSQVFSVISGSAVGALGSGMLGGALLLAVAVGFPVALRGINENKY